MENSIKKLMKKDLTRNIGVTIRESTYKKLLDYKEKNGIEKLSPFIDALLNDWLNSR